MASGRVLSLQLRLDAVRDKLDAELDKQAARDHDPVTVYMARVNELHEELNILTAPPGKLCMDSGYYMTHVFMHCA